MKKGKGTFTFSSMKIRVNGETIEVKEKAAIPDLFERLGIRPPGIAVELNGEIVPRSRHQETMLKENDSVEIVRMAGGG